ncbi:polysaccharide deacetylase family protein [Dyadobacter aurulentus]|uniref:polysaccharide deacetylase family protein n=1 Tax=Dyadobacter sp. UC 10 TaxID=2605428 RepID=UPI0011F0EC47|nr:polysaccharide deacetylase family protein [Dyadobacter sp. UC 10]KAA0993014.1 ChbG/HpnK family deacetylase [Dyadobacter sp. UC 10]
MTKTFLPFLLLLVINCSYAQQSAPRLIVRGDDMGYSHSGNLALLKCSKEGIQTSIEIIVPSPWFPEAVKMLQENPGIDVGIHLAITSEWDHVKWRPLTDCPSIRDADGYFFPMVRPNKNYPKGSIQENDWKLADIEKEFRAQIEMALRKLPKISHLSSHMGCTGLSPEVRELTRRLAKEYKIPIDPEPADLTYTTYDGPKKTSEEKIQSFISMLGKLQPGKTYLFVDHPGLNDAELQAISHIGYEDVAVDRQGVTDVFTSEKVKAAVKERGIILIPYRDLPH